MLQYTRYGIALSTRDENLNPNFYYLTSIFFSLVGVRKGLGRDLYGFIANKMPIYNIDCPMGGYLQLLELRILWLTLELGDLLIDSLLFAIEQFRSGSISLPSHYNFYKVPNMVTL